MTRNVDNISFTKLDANIRNPYTLSYSSKVNHWTTSWPKSHLRTKLQPHLDPFSNCGKKVKTTFHFLLISLILSSYLCIPEQNQK